MSIAEPTLQVELSALLDDQLILELARGLQPTYVVVPRNIYIRAAIWMVQVRHPGDQPTYLSPDGEIPLYYDLDAPNLTKIGFGEVL